MRSTIAALMIASVSGMAWAGDLSGSGIVVLHPSAEGALTMVGNSTVEIPAKAVYVNSNHAQAVKTTGNALLDCPNLYVCGGASFGGNSCCTGTVSHPSVAYQDPMSATAFPSSAGMSSISGSVSGGTVVMQPGYYASGISITGNASVTFSPGVYILNGNFKLTSGSVVANGVCFVMQGGSVNIAGASSLVMTPPSSGSMAGMVMAQPPANTNSLSMAGGSGVDISGTIYAPTALITLTGNSSVQGQGPMMGDLVIAKTVKLAGTAVIKIGHPNMTAVQLPSFPLFD